MEKSGRIRVRICGEQTDAAGAVQHTEMRAMARHDVKNGTHYLRYEDTTLLAGQAVPSLLKIAPASLTLVRHGPVEQRLEFVPRAERPGSYSSPYGRIPLAVRTREFLSVCRVDGTGRVELRYDLFLQGEFQGRCQLTIEMAAE
ncbi:MAG: DUF1934 domain-containing protein [Selenomonas sp.]|nr:DUF1934 domain-containing protein [Selenomonas sp.]